jgi:RimJ/RimL family protein N-acetyltransferase
MTLTLREATEGDLFFMIGVETEADAVPWLARWDRERHLQAFESSDEEPLIVESDGQPVGYALLSGIENEGGNLEVRRIVVSQKGQGVGREALRLAVDRAFELYQPHRVWLDLMVGNERAKRAYEAAGFTEEGTLRESLLTDDGYRSMTVMSILDYEWRMRRLYELFNAREVDALLAQMAQDVVWPNAIDGGHLLGREAVRRYWEGQFAEADPRVEPSAIRRLDDGRIEVRVRQFVYDLNGDLVGQGEVLHTYELGDRDLIARMEIAPAPDER